MRAPRGRYTEDYEMPLHEKQPLQECAWRWAVRTSFDYTDGLPPLPPMNEVISDSLRWDPLDRRWGRGAHWPLILGVGTKRERTPMMRIKRNAHAK